jgi:protein TonB
MMRRDAHISLMLSVMLHLALAIGLFTVSDRISLLSSQKQAGSKPLSIRLKSFQEPVEQKQIVRDTPQEKLVPEKEQPPVPTPEPEREVQEVENLQQEEGVRATVQYELLLDEAVGEPTDDYRALVVSLIASKKRYPARAQRLGIEGRVVVTVKISGTGKLLHTEIQENAEYSFFDREVLRMIQAAAPFPKPPTSMQGRDISVQIPVEFELR